MSEETNLALENEAENTESVSQNEETNPVEKTAKEETNPQSQEEIGKVIAGVKKKYREIGRQEGLEAAKNETEVPEAHAVENEAQREAPTQDDVPASAPPQNGSGGYDPCQDPTWNNKYYAIEARGISKFPDFAQKFSEAAGKSVNNTTLKELYQYAIGLGDENTLYAILTDPAKRGRMLEDRNCWNKELFNSTDVATEKVPTKLVAEPLSKLKVAPETGKRSFEDQGKWVREKNQIAR